MIVKFFKYGKGGSKACIDYLLGKDRDREHARVLSGDVDLTADLIDSSRFTKKYTAGCLSFAEADMPEDAKRKIMADYEKCLFPGMAEDQYNITWIEHKDKGRLELNFVIPCHELRTGKRLQPFYAGTDLRRVNAWKNITNRELKTLKGDAVADPNDPRRHRKINKYLGSAPKPSPFDLTAKKDSKKSELDLAGRDELRASIHRYMLAMLSERDTKLKNREAVLHELTTGLSLICEREAKSSITISHPLLLDANEKPLRVRLEGGIYSKDFTPEKFTASADEKYDNNRIRRKTKDDDNYKIGMEIKTEQNKELYKDAVAPPLLNIAVKPVITAETQQKGTETLPVADTAPKRPIQRPR